MALRVELLPFSIGAALNLARVFRYCYTYSYNLSETGDERSVRGDVEKDRPMHR